jgi:hypothetical protein
LRVLTRSGAALVAIISIAGCGIGLGVPPAQGDQVDPNEIGPIFAGPNGGPPIECRDIPREQCLTSGATQQETLRPFGDVRRVITTCLSDVCDASAGEYRIDVVLADGSTREALRGAYAAAPAPAR